MTREELEKCVADARQYGGFGLDQPFQRFLSHDAEQRAEIARLREALAGMLCIFGHNDGYMQVKNGKQVLKESSLTTKGGDGKNGNEKADEEG